MAETSKEVDNTVKPEESTSASGAVLAQAGIDASDSKVEEQVAAEEPKTAEQDSTVATDSMQSVSTTTDTPSKTDEATSKDDSTSTDRKRKYSNDDSSDFRGRRDRFQKGDEYRNHNARSSNNNRNNRYTNNAKSSYDSLPESSDPDAIRKQVEFYFSDSNSLAAA